MTEFARPFVLQRDADPTGVSGVGTVADGVVFPDGRVSLRWRSATASTNAYDSLDDALAVHGHGGSTRVVWSDARLTTGSDGLPTPAVALSPDDELRPDDETLLRFPTNAQIARNELHRIQGIARRHRAEVETADRIRAEAQRDRDQHAAVLTEVLDSFRTFTSGTGNALGHQTPVIHPDDYSRWRSVVAPTDTPKEPTP